MIIMITMAIIPKKIEAKIKCEVPKVHSDVVPMFPEPTPKKNEDAHKHATPKASKAAKLVQNHGYPWSIAWAYPQGYTSRSTRCTLPMFNLLVAAR